MKEMKVSHSVRFEVEGYADGWNGDESRAMVCLDVNVPGEFYIPLPRMSPGQARILADMLNKAAFKAEGGE